MVAMQIKWAQDRAAFSSSTIVEVPPASLPIAASPLPILMYNFSYDSNLALAEESQEEGIFSCLIGSLVSTPPSLPSPPLLPSPLPPFPDSEPWYLPPFHLSFNYTHCYPPYAGTQP